MPTAQRAPLRQAELRGIELLHRGKVRDIFAVDSKTLLLVATDRVSAFDVVLPDLLPHKGEILNRISEFWFRMFEKDFRHHLITTRVSEMPRPLCDFAEIEGRSMLVHRVEPLKAEFVVRGYLAGSAYKEYQESGKVCGIKLPPGLEESARLPEPIFTPSTKAPLGQHDENVSFEQLGRIVGADRARVGRDLVLDLYRCAQGFAERRGILIADTKIELGVDEKGVLIIDELFTPDSSRFWPMDLYQPGKAQPSFDKQIIRDALLRTGWSKQPPAPRLPQDILDRAQRAYAEIHDRLTGRKLEDDS